MRSRSPRHRSSTASTSLAVEVHQAPGSADLSFDARLEATGGVADTTPPSVPLGLTETGATDTSIGVVWAPSTDDVGVDRYDLFVDGAAAGSSLAPSRHLRRVGGEHHIQPRGRGGRRRRQPIRTVDATARDHGGPARGRPGDVHRRGQQLVLPRHRGRPRRGLDGHRLRRTPAGRRARPSSASGTATRPPPWPAGQVTHWFRADFVVGSAAGVRDLVADLLADDGAVIYLNGVEVVRDNMAAGPITATTPASTYRFGAAERTFRSFALPSAALVDGVNTIAVEVHQATRQRRPELRPGPARHPVADRGAMRGISHGMGGSLPTVR